MAKRPVFICRKGAPYFFDRMVDFEFFGGFALSQKQKCVLSLHESAKRRDPKLNLLEISRASTVELGQKLSAFNLTYTHENAEVYTVESVFQASKVFEHGGPYVDLLTQPSNVAKKDSRLKGSGRIVGFYFLGTQFPSRPMTAFYDWIYINALYQHEELHEELLQYNAFTDIAFNPEKSINCQARSVAIFVALKEQGLLEYVLTDFEVFISVVYRG